eukprot:Phypoly_transcript_08498.p1 GENE.Phypoly_transcript_08498~~Phypoly_transcript_08498.p1  ORF type:complete len:467 (+),score=72.41 Phypoly_transcript_08498:91-1491(+)
MELTMPWIVVLIFGFVLSFLFLNKTQNGKTLPFLFSIKNKKRAHEAILHEAESRNAKFLEIYLGFEKHFFVVHPDSMREVLKSDKIGQYQKVLTPMAAKLGTGSVFNQDIGDEWRKQRTVMAHPFHYDNMKSYAPICQRNTAKLIAKISENEEFELMNWTSKLALENLGSSIFGEELDLINGSGQIVEFLHKYEQFQSYNASPLWRMFAKIVEKVPSKARDDYAKLIDSMAELSTVLLQNKQEQLKVAKIPPTDVLSQLITNLPPSIAASNTFGLFLAGHETTARAIGWSLYYIGKNPDMQDKIYREIVQFTKGAGVSHDDIKQMNYLDMFVKEVLRIRPSVGQFPARYSRDDVTICGHFIPKNTPILLSIYTLQHLKEFWPNPEVFDPERFSPENAKNRHPFAYLPFSLGRRACIGTSFAILEIKVTIIMFLQKFKVTVHKDTNCRPNLISLVPDSVALRCTARK